MEKTINDFSLGLFLWAFLVIAISIAILYFIVKLYRKFIKKL